MKKVAVYFSDIMGTIFGKKENTLENYQEFSQLLEKIKQLENADEIIFSLVCADKKNLITITENTLFPFINNIVLYGKQFFENGYFKDGIPIEFEAALGKIFQIINYVNELSQSYDVVAIHYADDTKMYHQMLTTLAEKYGLELKLRPIIPANRTGLEETNSLLNDYINNKYGYSRQKNNKVRI